MSSEEINGHCFAQANPYVATTCTRCGAAEWQQATTCPVGLPRCESCKKPKAQSSADADSGRFCCKGFGASQSCAVYVPAYVNLQSEIYADSDVIVTHMHTDYTGSGIQVEEVPMTFERLYPGQYAEFVIPQRAVGPVTSIGRLESVTLAERRVEPIHELQHKGPFVPGTGGTISVQLGQYAEPVIPQRDIDADLGADVRKYLDTFTSAELYHLVRKLRAENHRLAPVMTNIFAVYRAAKGKMET